MSGLLDLVAVATIADCVSLLPTKSYVNRVFVKKGLELLNAKRRPCWSVFAEQNAGRIDADAVAFRLAPAIAAAGRLDWAEVGFRFLVAESVGDAREQWNVLQKENAERKRIEAELREQAFQRAAKLERTSLVVYLESGHPGVHGITASRLVEAFGKPAAVFSPKGAGARVPHLDNLSAESSERVATGSFRGVPGFDVRRALQRVAETHPGMLISFGGHPAAAGAALLVDDIEKFAAAYEKAVVEQLGPVTLGPVVWTDGELIERHRTLEAMDLLDAYGPFGRGFERPLYHGLFRVNDCRLVGDGKHLRLVVDQAGTKLEAIWFGAATTPTAGEIGSGDVVFLAYQLADNHFNGRRTLQAIVRHGRREQSI